MRRWSCVLVLLSALLLPGSLEGQLGGDATLGGAAVQDFRVMQNYPNPFLSDTRIPFELGNGAFPSGRPALVSMRIYNVLREWVATPTAMAHPSGDGAAVLELEYGTAGRHEVYWDGLGRSGTPVAAGVYLLEVTVNGSAQVLKMTVRR
jgi:hypothetical protein